MPQLPVILTAFSNPDNKDYLGQLELEYEHLKDIFGRLGYVNNVSLSSSSVLELADVIDRHKKELLIAHFGGFDNGSQLKIGQLKDSPPLSDLYPALKLVFLNGCKSHSQALEYLYMGIPAVIATTCSTIAGHAQEFAAIFYSALTAGHTLKESILWAAGIMKLKLYKDETENEDVILIFSAVRTRHEQVTEIPWRLYVNRGDVLEWKLDSSNEKLFAFGKNQLDYKGAEEPTDPTNTIRGPGHKQPSLPISSSPQGKNYIFAIAIDSYEYLPKLYNPVLDVKTFIEIMTTKYDFEKPNVIFINEGQATQKKIAFALDLLTDFITPQDNLIIYFSGHGRFKKSRGGFWVPFEGRGGDQDWSNYVSLKTVMEHIESIKSFHTFLIVDSCFSGSLFIDRSGNKFIDERRDSEPSRWALTSGKDEIVSDGIPGKHSPFASALLDFLRKAERPPGVMEICNFVMNDENAKKQQTPWGSTLKVIADKGGQMVLYFRDDVENHWKTALNLNTPEAYENYLKIYSGRGSKYNSNAIEKIKEFQEQEKEVWSKVPKDDKAALYDYIDKNRRSPFVKEADRLINSLSNFSPLIQEPSPETVVPENLSSSPIVISKDHMVLVKGETFEMGIGKDAHSVSLSDFLISKYLLTFGEYETFCRATNKMLPNDQNWGKGTRPIINVSWFDAIEYCNWLSQQEGLKQVYERNKYEVTADWNANGYRLPTEAEWEYASRGGIHRQGFSYSGSNNIDDVAWYNFNSENKTQPVGQKKPNELGLFDMSGNVWEWCWDWWHRDYLAAPKDPKGPRTGRDRICRGGSWKYSPASALVGNRRGDKPDHCDNNIGFRLARNIH